MKNYCKQECNPEFCFTCLQAHVRAQEKLLAKWVNKHQNYRGGSWDYDVELDKLLTDSEAILK